MKKIIVEYEAESGHKLNTSKSELLLCNLIKEDLSKCNCLYRYLIQM